MIIRGLLIGFGFIVVVGLMYRWILYSHGLTVTSWWRTPQHNERIGGLANSLHLIGWAFDVVPDNAKMRALLKQIGFGKIVPEGDHIHLQIL